MSKTVALVSIHAAEHYYYEDRVVQVTYVDDSFFTTVTDEEYEFLRWRIPDKKLLLVYEEKEVVPTTIAKLLSKNKKEKAAEERQRAEYAAKNKEREEKKKQRAIAKAQKLLEEAGL